MPKHSGGLCAFWSDPPDPFGIRPDIAEHSFIGGNTWILGAVFDQYGESGSSLTPEKVALAQQRTLVFLRAASDMQLAQIAGDLKVRVINWSGHKLPTGYPEGRRMWLNVKFYNGAQQLIAERGRYEPISAVLTTLDTKVYEARFGMDAATAAATNLPAGESFHLALNNVAIKDNRIPPKGFSNSALRRSRQRRSPPPTPTSSTGMTPASPFRPGAAQAVVTLFYQTTSKEYVEFLRDANVTNTTGQNAYDRWVARGKSAPVDMDVLTIPLGSTRIGDLNHDNTVNVNDLLTVIANWGVCPPPNLCQGDATGDNRVDVNDLLAVVTNWG